MSSPRLCDRCYVIFSENEEGWSSAPVTIKKHGTDGTPKPVNVLLDYCPRCTAIMTGEGNNSRKPLVPAVEGQYDPRYTRQLEEEAGIGDGKPSSMGT